MLEEWTRFGWDLNTKRYEGGGSAVSGPGSCIERPRPKGPESACVMANEYFESEKSSTQVWSRTSEDTSW